MTSVEIIAGIFAVLVLAKIIVFAINKEWWFNNITRPLYENSEKSSIIIAILALIVFAYLVQAVGIIVLFAALAFAGLLITLGFLNCGKDVIVLGEKTLKQKISYWQGVYIAVWIVLALWALIEILG